jgi:hypothetical protein
MKGISKFLISCLTIISSIICILIFFTGISTFDQLKAIIFDSHDEYVLEDLPTVADAKVKNNLPQAVTSTEGDNIKNQQSKNQKPHNNIIKRFFSWYKNTNFMLKIIGFFLISFMNWLLSLVIIVLFVIVELFTDTDYIERLAESSVVGYLIGVIIIFVIPSIELFYMYRNFK